MTKEERKAYRKEQNEIATAQAAAMLARITGRMNGEDIPPRAAAADTCRRRYIGYNGFSKVPSQGQRFRGHCGR